MELASLYRQFSWLEKRTVLVLFFGSVASIFYGIIVFSDQIYCCDANNYLALSKNVDLSQLDISADQLRTFGTQFSYI